MNQDEWVCVSSKILVMSYATKRFMVIFCPSMSIAKTSQSRLPFFIYIFYNRKPLKIFKDYIFSIICCKKKSKKEEANITLHENKKTNN